MVLEMFNIKRWKQKKALPYSHPKWQNQTMAIPIHSKTIFTKCQTPSQNPRPRYEMVQQITECLWQNARLFLVSGYNVYYLQIFTYYQYKWRIRTIQIFLNSAPPQNTDAIYGRDINRCLRIERHPVPSLVQIKSSEKAMNFTICLIKI